MPFGDLVGFLVAWNVWFYAAAVVAAVLFAVPSEFSLPHRAPSAAWLPEDHRDLAGLISAPFSGMITAMTVRGLDLGKWIHNIIGSISLLAVYAALVVLSPLGTPLPQHAHPLDASGAPSSAQKSLLAGDSSSDR